MKEATGLETLVKGNMQFVEASQATLDDEARRSSMLDDDSSPKQRRKLVSRKQLSSHVSSDSLQLERYDIIGIWSH